MSYWKFLKHSARMSLPMKHDFLDLGDALLRIGEFLATMAVRLALLVTLPITAPLLALVWSRLNLRAVERSKKAREEAIAGLMGMTQKR